ncbi:MAG: hypothetical protein GXO27_01855 [Chlorobi bacterium]|nr:hypothetical protein [Chlorobiota bacterium]
MTEAYGQSGRFYASFFAGKSFPSGSHRFFAFPPYGEFQVPPSGVAFLRGASPAFEFEAGYGKGKWRWGVHAGAFTHAFRLVEWCAACEGPGTWTPYADEFPHRWEGGEIRVRYAGLTASFAFLRTPRWSGRLWGAAGNMWVRGTRLIDYYAGDEYPEPLWLLQGFYPPEPVRLSYAGAGMEWEYALHPRWFLTAKTYYASTFKYLPFSAEYYLIRDFNDDRIISGEDIEYSVFRGTATEASYESPVRHLFVGLGITYRSGTRKPRTAASVPEPVSATAAPQEERDAPIILLAPANSKTIENPAKEKFVFEDPLQKKIRGAQYLIEVTHLESGRSLVYPTRATKVPVQEVMRPFIKEGKLLPGRYAWKVRETVTGRSSPVWTFRSTPCNTMLFAMSDSTVTCLGYKDGLREYEICFTSNFIDTTTALTFQQPYTGIKAYDQNLNPLPVYGVHPQPYVTQPADGNLSQVQYCFRVAVNHQVNQIVFGLQADSIPRLVFPCSRSIEGIFEELPPCVCRLCDTIDIYADHMEVRRRNDRFVLDGFFGSNYPVYKVEFQVVSLDYSANPSSCTHGVESVETSGVFLNDPAYIHGTPGWIFTSETASQSPTSNVDASRHIVYDPPQALTGNIGVKVPLGVPEPLPGLDGECCRMKYRLCVLIRLYYDEEKCQSCEIIRCFEFTR